MSWCMERRMLCKLDMKKAYDHVNWNFVDYILTKT